MAKIIKDDVDLGNLCLTELFDLSDVEVMGSFACHSNYLTSLEGIPKRIGHGASFAGDFWISKELRDRFPREYIRSLSDIKGTIVYW